MASRRSRGIPAAICAGIGAAVLAIGLLLASLHIVAFQESHYRAQYERLNVPSTTRIAMPDLMEVTRTILAYLRGDSDSMQAVVPVDGKVREVFTQRELDHMVDVRDLMLLARDAMLPVLSIGALFIALAWLLYVGKPKLGMARGLLWGEGVLLALLAVVAVYGIADFDNLFTEFHHLFFSNDLWQLDPGKSVLINMVPQPFFVATAARIAVMWGVLLLIEAALSAWLLLHTRKRDRAADKKTPIPELPGPERPEMPVQGMWKVVTVGTAADPDDSRYVIDGKTGIRPDAQAIFDRFGLGDEDAIELPPSTEMKPEKPLQATGGDEAAIAMHRRQQAAPSDADPVPAMRWFSPNIWGTIAVSPAEPAPDTEREREPGGEDAAAPEPSGPQAHEEPGNAAAKPDVAIAGIDRAQLIHAQERALALIDELEIKLNDAKSVSDSSFRILTQLRSMILQQPPQGGALEWGEAER